MRKNLSEEETELNTNSNQEEIGSITRDKVKQSGVLSLGSATITQMKASLKTVCIWIVVLGVIQYFLRQFGVAKIPTFLSLVLFILAGFALTNKVEGKKIGIWIPMISFFVWYFIFGGNYDPTFLTIFILIIGSIIIVPALITKGEIVTPELLGLVPVIFFFLDIGLLPFLIEKMSLPVSKTLINLVLFMPWWFFFGILFLPTKNEGIINFFVQVIRIVGILYLVFVLFTPLALPKISYDQSLLPSPEKFEAVQGRFREKLPNTENPAISNLICVFSKPTDVTNCVKERQENSEIKATCKIIGEEEGYSKSSNEYKNCLVEQKKERQEKTLVRGAEDPNIKKPTTAEFTINNFFPKEVTYRENDEQRTRYPAEFKLENPRKQNIQAEFSCNFKKSLKVVPGQIVGKSSYDFNNKEESIVVLCEPTEKLEGRYKLTYEVKLLGLKTTSRLQRAFITNTEYSEKKSLIKDIMAANFGGNKHLSQTPKDLAKINFAFGNSLNYPIIDTESSSVLSANVESSRLGELLAIKSYHLGLDNFVVDDYSCLDGFNVELEGRYTYQKNFYLPTCYIESYPLELESSEDYILKEFEATLEYDFLIKKTVNVNVKIQKLEGLDS